MFESTRQTPEAGMRRFGLAATLVIAAAGSAPGVQAAEQAPGAHIVKDPVSGQLRAPTATEAAALEAAGKALKSQRQAPARGLVTGHVNPGQIVHADGTVQQELDESSLAHTVVTRNADGTLQMACVTGADAVDAALNAKKTGKNAKTGQEHHHGHK